MMEIGVGQIDRRRWLGLTLGGLASSAWVANGNEEPTKLIVRGGEPLNAETPVDAFKTWLTPNASFFVRSHFGPPAVGLRPWRLEVGGDASLDLSPENLSTFEQVTIPAVLQCSGNGRSKFSPVVPGVGWERGAVGNAEWTGVRLADLLTKAGIPKGAAHVHLSGGDRPPNAKTPAFARSIPLERAMDASTIVATKMNGEPLPILHGGPMRLIVPGWTANHWIKWLRTIRLSAEEAPGFFQRTAYRMPRTPYPPGATIPPDELVPVTSLNVKSLIASPTDGARCVIDKLAIQGVAWTGKGRVARVDVSIDGGEWTPAELHGPDHEGSWRLWKHEWKPTPGKHVVRSRATDSSGDVQPETTPWNKSGYLWNGIDFAAFEVVNS